MTGAAIGYQKRGLVAIQIKDSTIIVYICAMKNEEVTPIEKLMAMKKEMARYNDLLEKAWESVITNEISKYPIAIFSTLPIEAGVLLIDRKDAPGPWSVSISTLEEFSVKGLIRQEKVEEFIKVYKDPELHFCTFVISDLGAQFVFIPR